MQMYHRSMPYSNRLLLERIRGGRVLDVGGSSCPDRANLLAGAASEVVLLDRKPPCGELAEKVSFWHTPVERITRERGLFDHVLLSNVLEHLVDPRAALAAVAGVLSAEGSIHILSPNCESLNRRIGVLMGKLASIRTIPEKETDHRHALSVGDVTDMIRSANLELRECRGVFLKPVPTEEMIRWPAERIAAFFEIAPQLPPELCHEVYFRASPRC